MFDYQNSEDLQELREYIENIQAENKELRDKLNHIKMVGYGNYKSIEKDIKEHFQNNELICIDDILHIIDNEIEKTGNLCTMCDGVNMYVKYEYALNTISKLGSCFRVNPISQLNKCDTCGDGNKLNCARYIAQKALDTPTAKEAVEKAHSEFEKYKNKTSL